MWHPLTSPGSSGPSSLCLRRPPFCPVPLSSRSHSLSVLLLLFLLLHGPTSFHSYPSSLLPSPPFFRSYLPRGHTCLPFLSALPLTCPIFFCSYLQRSCLSHLLLLPWVPGSLLPLHLLVPSAWNILVPFFTWPLQGILQISASGGPQRPIFSPRSTGRPLLPQSIVDFPFVVSSPFEIL